MKHTLKVWKAGAGTLVITIPKRAKEKEGIVEGSLVEVEYKKVGQEEPGMRQRAIRVDIPGKDGFRTDCEEIRPNKPLIEDMPNPPLPDQNNKPRLKIKLG